MKVIIRTDSSTATGSGHLMRCLTLADELRDRRADVSFICREHHGHLVCLVENRGFRVARLQCPQNFTAGSGDGAYASWLGVPWEDDAADTMASLKGNDPDWLIVDHYAIDSRWERKLRSHVNKIMVIDDLASRPHDCDLLLDQNLYEGMESRYDRWVVPTCQQLLGPTFALLRPDFAEARRTLRHRDGKVRRVLVFFGGVDWTNETSKTLNALAAAPIRKMVVDVVVGEANPHKEAVREFCSTHPGFFYHCQISNMAEMMTLADLAIGAGGATTWERCATGLPALVIAVAENQVDIARSADKAGAIKYLGMPDCVGVETILTGFSALSASESELLSMSEMAARLVDGNGVARVADIMGFI